MKKLLIAGLVVFALFGVTTSVSAGIEIEYPDSTLSIDPEDV
ncbi:hypothetical protein [Oceanobacillus locisalsi]|uniref:Phosphatase n=1 Tax=Oceanobacillus locisalsi TaxID=546107 RepID=A0ABW3NAX1_9BACI